MPVSMGMTKHKHMLSSAPIAIAAMAALSTVPASAQSQPQIVLDIPETQTAPAPEPTIVLTEPEVTIQEPVVTEAAEAPAQTTPAADPGPVARQSARAPQPVVAAPVEAAPSTDTTPVIDAPLAALPQTAATEAEIAANRAQLEPAAAPVDDASGAALILALLGVGGIGLLAFFLMRRRRKEAVPVIERPVVTEPVRSPAPVMERDTVVMSHDEAHVPAASIERTATAAAVATPAYAARSDGAAVELPPELPTTFAERDTLLKRMINARPDRANPFKSPRARARRARLIMQSLGTSFRNRTPRIDLSQYTNIWPELRGWKPATA